MNLFFSFLLFLIIKKIFEKRKICLRLQQQKKLKTKDISQQLQTEQ